MAFTKRTGGFDVTVTWPAYRAAVRKAYDSFREQYDEKALREGKVPPDWLAGLIWLYLCEGKD